MENYILTTLLWLFRAVCILFAALCLIVAGVSFIGTLTSAMQYFFKKVAHFQTVYLVKFFIALAAAIFYIILYRYKGFSLADFHADLPKTMILMIVSVGFPATLLGWANQHFKTGKAEAQ